MLHCDIIVSTSVWILFLSFFFSPRFGSQLPASESQEPAWNVDRNSSERQYVCSNYTLKSTHIVRVMLSRAPVPVPLAVRQTTRDNEYDIIKRIISFMHVSSTVSRQRSSLRFEKIRHDAWHQAGWQEGIVGHGGAVVSPMGWSEIIFENVLRSDKH